MNFFKDKIMNIVLLATANIIALCTFFRLFRMDGFLDGVLTHSATIDMLGELAIYALIMIQILLCIRNRYSYLINIIVILVFAYSHYMILPIVFAFLYMLQIYFLGDIFVRCLLKDNTQNIFMIKWVIGAALDIIIYALMSLLNIGSIGNIRIFALISVIVMAIIECVNSYKKQNKRLLKMNQLFSLTIIEKLLLCLIVVFFMINIGRAPITIDYDSAWYGLRSPFVLDHGNGFYEDLKFVGCVYTYSKGYEILALPMAFVKTYGFVYAFNIMMAALIIIVVYKFARLYLDRKWAVLIAAMTASLSSLMNMSITAKPDVMTALVQLISVYYAAKYLRDKEDRYYYYGITAFLFSLALKPSSIIFSLSVYGMIICYRIYKLFKKQAKIDRKGICESLISVVALSLVWLRTYIILGLPATSIWTGLFEKMGFSARYPYTTGLSTRPSNFKSIAEIFTRENYFDTLLKIKNYYLGPHIGSMDHVILAWGTSLPTISVILLVITVVFRWKYICECLIKRDFLFLLFYTIIQQLAVVSILFIGTSSDGNYYIIPNVLTVVFCAIIIVKAYENKADTLIILKNIYSIYLLLNILIMATTNWAFSPGFVKCNWNNEGYYDNAKKFRKTLIKEGMDATIYDKMTENQDNRVLMFAMHSKYERIPCMSETELDITYWGNNEIFETVDGLVSYLDYVGCNYLFVQSGYLADKPIQTEYIVDIISRGIIGDIIFDKNGNVLMSYGKKDTVETSELVNTFIDAIRITD